MPTIHLIGVPLDLGAGRRGVDMGPSALRVAGLAERIAALGHPVVDKGDLPAPNPEVKGEGDRTKKYAREIGRVCQRLYQVSLAAFEAGRSRWCLAAITAWRQARWRRRPSRRGAAESRWA